MATNLGDATLYKVKQVDLAYFASLDPPAFDLGDHWLQLEAAIYRNLGRFKLRLSDIKVETATANPVDFAIACWILNYSVVVRYRFDRIEVWSNKADLAEKPELMKAIVERNGGSTRGKSRHANCCTHGQRNVARYPRHRPRSGLSHCFLRHHKPAGFAPDDAERRRVPE